MNKRLDIQTATDEEIIKAVEGMLNAKNEWLKMIAKREKELGLA